MSTTTSARMLPARRRNASSGLRRRRYGLAARKSSGGGGTLTGTLTGEAYFLVGVESDRALHRRPVEPHDHAGEGAAVPAPGNAVAGEGDVVRRNRRGNEELHVVR